MSNLLYLLSILSISWLTQTESVFGLECYTCANTGVSIFKQSFDVNEECESPKLGGDVPTEVCASGESCGMISGTINSIFGSSKTTVRACMPLNSRDAGFSGCETASTDDLPAAILAEADGIKGIDGEVCYCNTDFCVAQQCSGGVIILSYCVKLWMLGLGIVLVLFCVTGFCCCCCCCCRCCRQKASSGSVIRQPLVYAAVPPAQQQPAVIA